MPGVHVAGACISIGCSKRPGNISRHRFVYHIDLGAAGGADHTNDDLQSGCNGAGADLQSGLATLLSFLGAAAESYAYRQRTGHPGENEDLFPPHIVAWACQNSDELSTLASELDETPNLIA